MAKGRYQKLYEARMKRLGKTSNTDDDLQRQVNNLKARLEAGGVKNPEADDRNALEKWLNLEQDQGIIGDVLELLERPFQAIKTGITSAQEGDSALKGAWEGLSGQKDTEFKEVLMNTGGFEDEKGKLDLVDVLGYAGDVFLDPLDLALIPVTGGASVAVGAVDTAGDVAKAVKAADTVADASKAVKLKSVNDLLFEGAGKVAKKGAKLADTGIEKGLKKLDEAKGIKYLDDTAKSVAGLGKIVDEGSEYANKLGNLEIYKGAKEGLSNMFKLPKNVTETILKRRKLSSEQDIARIELEALKNKWFKATEEVINKGKLSEFGYNSAETLIDDTARFLEYVMNRGEDNSKILKLAKEGKLQANEAAIDSLENMVKTSVPETLRAEMEKIDPEAFKITVDETTGRVKLGSGFNKVDLDTSGKTIISKNYTMEQYANMERLLDMYKYNKGGYRDYVDNVFGSYWAGADSDIEGLSKLVSQTTDQEIGEVWHGENPEYYNNGKARSTFEDTQGKHPDNRLFTTDNKIMADSYTGYSNMTADPVEKPGLYKFRVERTGKEKVLKLDANGGSWTSVKYNPQATRDAFTSIDDDTINKLIALRKSNNSKDFIDKLMADKTLSEKLKKYGIDVINQDIPKGFVSYNDGMSVYKNIDAQHLSDALYGVSNADEFRNTIRLKFSDFPYSTDFILNDVYKGNQSGRNKKFNTVEISNIRDWGGSHPSRYSTSQTNKDYVFTDVNSIEGRKLIQDANRVPDFTTRDTLDVASNATYEPSPSLIDKANKRIDDVQNASNLSRKYSPFENSDYVMPHILTPEGKELAQTLIDKGFTRGNSNILKSRTLFGSIDEINNYLKDLANSVPENKLSPEMLKFKKSGANFMEDSFLLAFENNYISKYGLTNIAKETKFANEILLDMTFKDFNEAIGLRTKLDNAIKSGVNTNEVASMQKRLNSLTENSSMKILSDVDDKIPLGYTKVYNSDIIKKLDKYIKMNTQLGNDGAVKSLMSLKSGLSKSKRNVAINTDIARMLDFTMNEKTVNGLSELYNRYLNFFKKWKTASPTFVMNAFIGNSSNLALSGISPLEQAKYGPKVANILQNGQKLFTDRAAGKILNEADNEIADLWFEYRKMGFDKSAFKLQGISEELQDLITGKQKYNSKLSKAINFVPQINNLLNETFDTSGRLTVMLKALDDPSYMEKLGVNNVYDAISKVMFDPDMTTEVEKSIKKFIPFYIYSKNNLVYQATNIFKNPTKYSRLMKGMRSLQNAATGGNEENMAEYLKDSLYIPIPGLDENGNYTIIRASLPFGQLIETVDDPMQSLTNMLSPAIKAPIEYATGIDSFTGREIEKFPGEKSSQIPFLTKKQQKFISDFSGLDVPLKSGYRLLTDPMSTITMENNVDTDRISKMYDEIYELRNMMKQYEQEGYQFSTMTELRKANKNNTVSKLDAIFAKYDIE